MNLFGKSRLIRSRDEGILFLLFYRDEGIEWSLSQVEVMVEERIQKQFQTQRDTRSSGEMKDEIRHLWAEVEALVKSREEMQGHVEHLTSVAQKTQEHANREQEMLKSENGYLRKQLQSLKNDGVQVKRFHLAMPCCIHHKYLMDVLCKGKS